jgi:hypothetical protein
MIRTGRTFAVALLLAAGALAPVARAASSVGGAQTYCATAVHHGPNRSTGPSAAPARGCRYDTGVNSQSPAIAVTRKGVVFVAQATGGVVRSLDGGSHWEKLVVPAHANGDDHVSGGHGYVHVDPVTDRVWYVTSSGAASCGGSSGAVVSWTDDLGRTWGGATVGCDTYDWGRLVTGTGPAGGTQRAVYFFGVSPRPIGGIRLVYRSLDGGRTWQRTRHIASSTTESGAGVSAPDGTIYFDYPEFIGFDPANRLLDRTYPFRAQDLCRQMVAVSEDFGDTWRQEAIPGTRACNHLYGQQRVAVDRNGIVYAVWTDDIDGQLYLAHSRDHAHTWSAPMNVMPPGATFNNGHGNVVAGEGGHIVISAMDTSSPLNPRLGIVAGLGDWHSYLTESFDATSARPHFQSVDLDPRADPSLTTGETPTEAEGYVAMSRSGQGWATFARHGGPALGNGARIVASRFVR